MLFLKKYRPYLDNRNYSFCLIGALSLGLSHPGLAASFCDGKSNISVTNSPSVSNISYGSNDCTEFGNNVTATNIDFLDGSMTNVIGRLEDSTIDNGAEVWINKTLQISVGSYDSAYPATGSNLEVKSGGLVRITDGAILQDSHVNGGLAYISNTGSANDPGQSYDNTVSNGGELYSYLDGESYRTIVNQGGAEYVQQSGTSLDTTVNDGGQQGVYSQGVATNTTVKSGGQQQVSRLGVAESTLIEAGAFQYVYNQGHASNTVVYGTQHLYLLDSAWTAGTASNTSVYGNGRQIIQSGGSANGVQLHDNAEQYIRQDSSATDVTIHDNALSWVSSAGQILGSTQIYDSGQLRLETDAGTSGAYAESVSLNSSSTSILVLANAADNDSAHIGTLTGSGIVRFITNVDSVTNATTHGQLNVDSLSGNMHFHMNTALQDGRGDYLSIQNGSGSHLVTVADSGKDITHPGQSQLDLITDYSSGASFNMASLNGAQINAVDGGTYMYHFDERADTAGSGKIWYLYADGNGGGELETTPSTDAVLSLATVPLQMFNNEMDNLRFRMGSLKENDGQAGVWGRFTGNKNNVSSSHVDYKLEQAGLEAGVDKIITFENGRAFVGTFVTYSNATAKQKRGGTSEVDSYGAGVYATWFDNSGIYIDGVLKYNRYDNTLKAISTNGNSIHGDYNQNALGTSAEIGYNTKVLDAIWAEPYARLSYVRLDGKDITLNNGMEARIDDHDSLRSEFGVSVGKSFSVDNQHLITPYVKVAWIHEYIDNNKTVVNGVNRFTTDLSGDAGKVGLGVSTNLYNNRMSIFGEVNYTNGNRGESPVRLNLGMRYNF